jgi:hypothetical protein
MRRLRPIVVLCACLAAAPAAWAATKPPVKGAHYEGVTAAEGPTIVQGKAVRKKANVLLKVAKSGKSVTVLVPSLPTSCAAPNQGAIEKTSPVHISSKGAFKGTMTYVGVFDPSVTAKASFSGHFNGRRASGSIRSEFLKATGCNNSTTFTATAPAPPKHK